MSEEHGRPGPDPRGGAGGTGRGWHPGPAAPHGPTHHDPAQHGTGGYGTGGYGPAPHGPGGAPGGYGTSGYGSGGYGPPPSGQEERTWSLLAHVSYLVAAALSVGWLSFVGPLVIYLVHRDRSPVVRHHSAEALNMAIAVTVYSVVLGIALTVLGVITLGLGFVLLPLAALPAVAGFVLAIVAAVRANRGEPYRYPLIFRLVR